MVLWYAVAKQLAHHGSRAFPEGIGIMQQQDMETTMSQQHIFRVYRKNEEDSGS